MILNQGLYTAITNAVRGKNAEKYASTELLVALKRCIAPAMPAPGPRGGGAGPTSLLVVLPPGAKAGRLATNLRETVHPALRELAARGGAALIKPSLPTPAAYREDLVHLSLKGAAAVVSAVAEKFLPPSA